VSEKKVSRRIFGLRSEELVGGWRRLNNKELHSFYATQNIIGVIEPKRMKWAGHIACVGERRNAYNIFIGKPEEKRILEKQRKCEDNIRMHLREILWDWME
jgi:hypothetical protein